MTIDFTVQNGLCCSCGVCKRICPRSCIDWKKDRGMFYPAVDNELCVRCGSCAAVCPGLEMRFPHGTADAGTAVLGPVLESYNAWSRSAATRHASASGGVVSTLVETLLRKGAYSSAFLLSGYGCAEQYRTTMVSAADLPLGMAFTDHPKSRYLPVSHEAAIDHMTHNRHERIILIGTSCAIRGLKNVIRRQKLEEANYLLIGLFCDKVFNYNIFSYYSHTFFSGHPLRQLHFKNKESGGWPGNMKFFFDDGEPRFLDREERAKVKDYFMPERCLYCVDKLNVCADISLGDNYTDRNVSPLGSNSVLLRTVRGKQAWDMALDGLEYAELDPALLWTAQYMDGRMNNLAFAALKQRDIFRKTKTATDLNPGLQPPGSNADYERAWKTRLKMLRAGMDYAQSPQKLQRQLSPSRFRRTLNKFTQICGRIYYALKRRLNLGAVLKKIWPVFGTRS